MPSKSATFPKRRLLWLVVGLMCFLLFLCLQMPVTWLLGKPDASARIYLLEATGNVLSGTGRWQWHTDADNVMTGQIEWRLSPSGLLAAKPYHLIITQGQSHLSGQASIGWSDVELYDWTGHIAPQTLQSGLGLMTDMPIQVNALSGTVGDTPILTGQASMAPAHIGYRLHGLQGRIAMPALQADIRPSQANAGTDIHVLSSSGQLAELQFVNGQLHIGLTYRLLKEVTGLSLGLAGDDAIMMRLTR